jgi:hypothetical protein
MAIKRQQNWLGQQRVDVPHLRTTESAIAADFDLLAGRMIAGKMALVLKGYNLITTGALGAPATSLKLRTAGGMLMHYGASEAGTIFGTSDTAADEQLSAINPKVTGSFTASQTNFIGLDLSRSADDTTADNVQFLEPVSDGEISKTVPLGRTLDVRLVISASDFSSQPTVLPLAKVVTDASNNVSSIQDARQMMFRLADGGDSPNTFSAYTWPGTRAENTTGDVFSGGDKSIADLKTWMDSIMTRLWEVGGGERWYSATADRNVTLVWINPTFTNGENYEFVASNLHWKGIRMLFDNSTGYLNDINDQTGNSPGLTDLVNGECLYVDLDRTKFHVQAWTITTAYAVGDYVFNDTDKAYICTVAGTSAGAGGPTGTGTAIVDGGGTLRWDYVGPGAGKLTAAKAPLASLGSPLIPGQRQILAWRVGSAVYTRGWRYPIGTLFIPATTTAQGVVKISRDYLGVDNGAASSLNDPVALSDRGGVITVPTVGAKGVIIKRFDAGANIMEWQTAAGTALGNITNAGDLNFVATARRVTFDGGNARIGSPGAGFLDFYLNSGETALGEFFHSPGAFVHAAVAGPGLVTAILRGTTTAAEVRATGAFPLDFVTNNVTKWRVDSAGNLTAVGATRSVLQMNNFFFDADDKGINAFSARHFSRRWMNMIGNGAFRYWQRATAATAVPNTPFTVAYFADRWCANAGGTNTISRQAAGLNNFRYCLRYQRTAGDTDLNVRLLHQEIDRETMWEFMRDNPNNGAIITFWARTGANFSGNLVVQLRAGSGAEGNNFINAGYTNGIDTITGGFTSPLSGTWTQYTLHANAITDGVGAVPTQLSLHLRWTPTAGVAGANEYYEITGIMVTPQHADIPTTFAPFGGSDQADLEMCRRYYEKSYEVDTVPGTNTAFGEHYTNVLAVATGNTGFWALGAEPQFLVEKWKRPVSVSLWAQAGTASQWFIGGANRACSTDVDGLGTNAASTRGFKVTNNTGGLVTPTAQEAHGHWAADAEFY